MCFSSHSSHLLIVPPNSQYYHDVYRSASRARIRCSDGIDKYGVVPTSGGKEQTVGEVSISCGRGVTLQLTTAVYRLFRRILLCRCAGFYFCHGKVIWSRREQWSLAFTVSRLAGQDVWCGVSGYRFRKPVLHINIPGTTSTSKLITASVIQYHVIGQAFGADRKNLCD